MDDDFSFASGTGDDLGSLLSSAQGAGYDVGDLSGLDLGGLGGTASAGMDSNAGYGQDWGALATPTVANDNIGSPNVGSPSEAEIVKAGGTTGTVGGKSIMDQAKGMLNDKNGDLDLSKLIKLGLGLASFTSSLGKAGTSANAKTAAQLQAELAANQKNTQWTPQQAQWSNNFFNTPVNPNRGFAQPGTASAPQSSIVPSRGYADGGQVGALNLFERTRRKNEIDAGLREGSSTLQDGTTTRAVEPHRGISDLMRSLPMLIKSLMTDSPQQATDPSNYNPAVGPDGLGLMNNQRPRFADGGDVGMPPPGMAPMGALTQADPNQGPFSGFVQSDTPGQADLIDIKVAGGEYVVDADTVSGLGDGNNAAGAKMLDQLREKLRVGKRDAPPDEIPPQTSDIMGAQ